MSKVFNILFAMLCGVSILITPTISFSVNFGENRELDNRWKGATSTLGRDIDQLVDRNSSDEGSEIKQQLLRSTTALERIETIFDLSQQDYALAHSYIIETLPGIAKQMASWLYPHEDGRQELFYNGILKNSLSLLNIANGIPEENPNIHSQRFQKLEDNDLEAALLAIKLEEEESQNVGARKNLALEKSWSSLQEQFITNFKTEPDIAQMALNDLQEISYIPEVYRWLTTAPEIFEFVLNNIKNHAIPHITEVKDLSTQTSPWFKIYFSAHRDKVRENFKPIKAHFTQLQLGKQNACVHKALDEFYRMHLETLLNIGNMLFPENSTLNLAQIKAGLNQLLNDRADILETYTYESQQISLPEMQAYINQVYQDDMPVQLCSQTYNLAIQMLNARDDPSTHGVHSLFDALVENYKTEGGCLEGRRNRQFRSFVTMLGLSGL